MPAQTEGLHSQAAPLLSLAVPGSCSTLMLHVFSSWQMCRRVYKGIPLQVRGQVWSLLLDVEKMKKENEGKYEVRLRHGQREQVGIHGGRGYLHL